MAEIKPPKVFISYAWEDDVKKWVRAFATLLRNDGVETIFDEWVAVPGDQLPEFMEKSVRESDFVLVICTPKYKRKTDNRMGGVGYEGNIITSELITTKNERKFIPVLCKGEWVEAAPSWVLGKYYIDLSGAPYDENNYQKLLRTLLNRREIPPPVGMPHEFPSGDSGPSSVSSTSPKDLFKGSDQVAPKSKINSKFVIPLLTGLIIITVGFLFQNVFKNKPSFVSAPTLETLPATMSMDAPLVSSKVVASVTLTPTETLMSPNDGTTLINISAGEFLRGLSEKQVNLIMSMCSDCKREYVVDEMPQKLIYLNEFWIDQMEVTNAQFARFINEVGYVTSAEKKVSNATYVFSSELHDFVLNASADWQHPHGTSSNINGLDTTPVTQVSWDDANAYCKWIGRRLPTEAEWEKAARGTDGRLFVWGNEPPSDQFLNFNLNFHGPQPGGSYTLGASPYGIEDMAGNVWEWVSDYYNETYYQNTPSRNPTGPTTGEGHSLRGGSWASEYKDLYLFTATSRIWNRNYVRSDVLGFRCAKDANP